MSDSEVEPEPEPEPQPRRGRPSGQTDATKRYRRTAAEISEDKIRVAEMRLQALREAEERKLANKKPRTKRPRAPVEEVPVKERESSSEGSCPRLVTRKPTSSVFRAEQRRAVCFMVPIVFIILDTNVKTRQCRPVVQNMHSCKGNTSMKICSNAYLRIARRRGRERSITWPRCATVSKNSEGTCVTGLIGCRRLLKRITSRTLPSSPPESTPPKKEIPNVQRRLRQLKSFTK